MKLRINGKLIEDSPSAAGKKVHDAAANRSQPSDSADMSQANQRTDSAAQVVTSPPRLPKKEDAIFFHLVEDTTSDDYLEALLEFVQPQQIRFAAKVTSPPPARLCVYLNGEKTVAKFIRHHGYVRLRQHRLYAFTTRQPAFRLTLSNVCPVLPNALLEAALERDLRLRLCSPIAFVKADCANPALRHVLGFERSVYCCAGGDGKDDPVDGSSVPSSMVVQYDSEEFRILLSVDSDSRSSGLSKSPCAAGGCQQTPTVTFDERVAASKRQATSSTSDETVIVVSNSSNSEQLRRSHRVKKQKVHS